MPFIFEKPHTLSVAATDYIPHISYDSVVFGFSGDKLKILIVEYHNTKIFALPGGFLKRGEDLNDAVRRGLEERTGIGNIYLEQFYTFGDVARYQPQPLKTILEANGFDTIEWKWMLERFITVAYYALINYNDVIPKPDHLSDSCTWYDVNDLPPLMLDHAKIVKKAIQVLRENLDRKLVGMNLLPEKFTMKQLQQVYEAILGNELRRTTFQRRMLSSDLLVRHEKQYSGKAHKAPFLYSFR
jgi:ADP-ribose pyrophosphatase YjhB (NUDIX family)